MRGTATTKYLAQLGILLLMLLSWSPPVALGGEEPDGKALFLSNKCNMCHGVESEGIVEKSKKMRGPDLSSAGEDVSSAEWLKGFLLKEDTKDGSEHKTEFKGDKKELEVIIDWVLELKTN